MNRSYSTRKIFIRTHFFMLGLLGSILFSSPVAAQVLDVAPAPDILVCDVNLDGEVNFFDIRAFILRLTSGTYQLEADCDENGELNFFDIQPFLTALAGN